MGILRALALLILVIFSPTAMAASSEDGATPPGPVFEAAMSRGDVLLAGGDDQGAEREYRAALEQAPAGQARADVLHKLGIALANQSRFADAEPLVAEAEKIARARPAGVLLADVLRAKTVILYKTGRIDAARAAFREAKAILEASANVWETEPNGTTWRHTPSRWRFADAYGPLRRIRRTMLDEAGKNIVVHYRIGPGGWAATLLSVYVSVDRNVPLVGEFDATLHEIIRKYPDADVIRTGPTAIGDRKGFEAVLDLPTARNGNVRRTSLSAFGRGNVIVRLNFAFRRSENAAIPSL